MSSGRRNIWLPLRVVAARSWRKDTGALAPQDLDLSVPLVRERTISPSHDLVPRHGPPASLRVVDAEASGGPAIVLAAGAGQEPGVGAGDLHRDSLPTVRAERGVGTVTAVVQAVNNGAGLWARPGGKIGTSEVRALRVLREPTPQEVDGGADPELAVEATGYEALSLVFDHASLDAQTEIYRRLSRKRPWWAGLDIFGWFKGARAPVERFEEIYEPGGNVEVFVMGHDHGSWLFPKLFKRHFHFTKGGSDWRISRDEVTRRGGDVEADRVIDRGYARSIIQQFADMTPAQRWRALTALEPDLLDSPITSELAAIDPTWFDPNRFGVAVLFDPEDHEAGERLRDQANHVREFFFDHLGLNPYLVESGFDTGFLPLSRDFPEVPSEQIHQFAVDVRELLPRRDPPKLDLPGFADFLADFYPRWPRVTPEQLHRVRAEDDYARFVGKRVDLWGWARRVRIERYTKTEVLNWSSREPAGRDSQGRRKYRTRSTRWTVEVPCVRGQLDVVGEEGLVVPAIFQREGGAQATGHYTHHITQPERPDFSRERDLIPGHLEERLLLVI